MPDPDALLSRRRTIWPDVKTRLQMHLGGLHVEHASIARGIVWVLLFSMAGRLAGAAKEVAIAARYGTGEIVDAYLFVFNLLTWPVAVWFSVLTVVLIPTVARVRQEDPTHLGRLQGALVLASALLGGALAIACGLALWMLLAPPAAVLPDPAAAMARDMVGYLAPLLPLGFLVALYSAWLMATGRHANTLMEAIPPLTLLLVILAASDRSAEPLVWGTLIGFGLHLAVLCGYLGRLGTLARPRLSWTSPQWQALWWSIGVMAFGQLFSTASIVVDQIMAGPLGPGAIATLGYAVRVLGLITALTALVITRATLPVFSDLRAANDQRLDRLAISWAGLLFLIGTAAAAVAYGVAPWGVAVLFERGAFTADDSRAVAHVFSFALPQLPFYCAGLVLTSHLAATGHYWMLTRLGILNLAVKIGANWALIPVFGVAGITLATGAMYVVSSGIMALVIWSMRRERLRTP